jgi:hypothetical protein
MPLGIQEVEAPRISRQSINEYARIVSPTLRLPLPSGDLLGSHFY